MADQWYYAKSGNEHGPVTAKGLKQLADAGDLEPSDLVWKNGMNERLPARRVKGLFAAQSAASTPVSASVEPSPENAKLDSPKANAAAAMTPPRMERPAAGSGVHSSPSNGSTNKWLVIGVAILGLAACGWLVKSYLLTTPNTAAHSLVVVRTPSTEQEQVKQASELLVAEFKLSIQQGIAYPIETFYQQFGRPIRTDSSGVSVFLYFRCKDGIARVECESSTFKVKNEILVMNVG